MCRPFLTVWLLAGVAAGMAAPAETGKLPAPAAFQVDYLRDIKPIFDRSCLRCHGTERPKSDFSLVTREAMLRGGAEGKAVIPGNSAASPLVHYIAGLVPDMEMPPPGKAPPVSAQELALIRAWIDQGVAWDETADALAYAPRLTLTTQLGGYWVGGRQNLFREHAGQREGAWGGVQELAYSQRFTNGALLEVEARALLGTPDYAARLSLSRPKIGFVRAGMEQYRRYYEDSGGYYGGMASEAWSLGRELKLDVGRAWLEVGLTRPALPQITLGYEHRYRQGDKSLTQWGDVTDAAGEVRRIYPAWKRLDEETHLVRLDVAHQWHGWRFSDQLRLEFSRLHQEREQETYVVGKDGPDKVARIVEQLRSFQAVNTLQVEKQLRPWLFGAAGYLYQTYDARAGHEQGVTYLPPSLAPPAPGPWPDDKFWSFNHLILRQESHVANLNVQLKPWRHLTLAAGLQPEWQSQEGLGHVILDEGVPVFAQTAWINATHDRVSLTEDAGLRFTAIPYTVLFADARFRQESLEQYEFMGPGNFYEFGRRMDASADQRDYRAGVSISPWSRFSWTGHFRRRERYNHYHHPEDIAFMSAGGFPNDGYSAFITSRRDLTDEWETKLAWRAHKALKVSLGYRYRMTDWFSATDPLPWDVSPGGGLQTAVTRGHTFTATLTLTPHPRFYVSSTLAWTESKTAAFAAESPSVAPWRGTTWTLMNSATYLVSRTTDVHAGYSVTHSDFRQPQGAEGLPLGSAFTSHVAQAGLMRRFGGRMTAGLNYVFYHFDEAWDGAGRSYVAHGVLATLRMDFTPRRTAPAP
ncbi:hypothetical protein NXS98_17665 [Fontisphaera persica]|uniref:c-type cytochrome domain-containing protein n=1 Tax=Fontisphaera persica TaxID=2974023 RepID=UPI0024C02245|nr:c-type cytochrome domain-containing protein [Fontisphaera persica]WCJ59519.1 hypothetical protein NXS98_17665 [Fontisphaera persica]